MSTSSAPSQDPVPNSRPQPQTTQSSSSTAQTASKPPVLLHPTAHLDPGAYVRGTHAISLGANVLVHPRAQLVSIHGPLIIDSGCIVSEKCVVGGPVPDPRDPSAAASITEGNAGADVDADDEGDPIKTLIGPNVYIHPHAQIHAGTVLNDSCTIESHAMILKCVSVGAHSKICAGCTVDRDVGQWQIVFGDGDRRRKRVVVESVETGRLKGLEKDREATSMILRTAARAPVIRKK